MTGACHDPEQDGDGMVHGGDLLPDQTVESAAPRPGLLSRESGDLDQIEDPPAKLIK